MWDSEFPKNNIWDIRQQGNQSIYRIIKQSIKQTKQII